ncbi:hypothetical protein [Microbulbifer variabilis]|nr:hypothetical protein [Microbulbifer variabilis]
MISLQAVAARSSKEMFGAFDGQLGTLLSTKLGIQILIPSVFGGVL